MKALSLFIALSASNLLFAQKTISVKKGTVKENDIAIAEYDSKGSGMKPVTLFFFPPGSTTDTIMTAQEEFIKTQNPLFDEVTVVLKVEFKAPNVQPFFILSKYGKNEVRSAAQLVFNDSVPVLIKNAKLDEAAAADFKAKYAFDADHYLSTIKIIEDTIASLNKVITVRNTALPVEFRLKSDRSTIATTDQKFEIYQDKTLIGILSKKGQKNGGLPRFYYEVYKVVANPVTVRGKTFDYSPVGICKADGSSIPVAVRTEIIDVVSKQEIKITGASYDTMEQPIVQALIRSKLL